MLSWFRSSGRTFWPVAWLSVGLAIAASLDGSGRRLAITLASAGMLLQAVDVAPWFWKLHAVVSAPVAYRFGPRDARIALASQTQNLGLVTVVPAAACMDWSREDLPDVVAAIEVQLNAARHGVVMPDPLLSSFDYDCAAMAATPLPALAAGGVLVVFDQEVPAQRLAEARADFSCSPFSRGLICAPRRDAGPPPPANAATAPPGK